MVLSLLEVGTIEERVQLLVLTIHSLNLWSIRWHCFSVVASSSLVLVSTSYLLYDQAAESFTFLGYDENQVKKKEKRYYNLLELKS